MKRLVHAVGKFLLTLFFGIPAVKPLTEDQCIVVANHNTHLDTLILFRLFPLSRLNRVKVIAAQDYFGRGMGGFLGRHLFNLILLDRRATKAVEAIGPVEDALQQGCSIIVFPEGTRGEPGVVQPFKSGIGKLALDFPELPVYPVCLHGIEKTLPKGGTLPVPFSVRLEVMAPVFGKEYLHLGSSKGRKQFATHLEGMIRKAKDGAVSDGDLD